MTARQDVEHLRGLLAAMASRGEYGFRLDWAVHAKGGHIVVTHAGGPEQEKLLLDAIIPSLLALSGVEARPDGTVHAREVDAPPSAAPPAAADLVEGAKS